MGGKYSYSKVRGKGQCLGCSCAEGPSVGNDISFVFIFPVSKPLGPWAGSGGVLNVGARHIPAHPAPLPNLMSGEPQLQLRHFQRKILCAPSPPHLCPEQGVRCRCLGYSSHGAWQCSWGRQHVGFGVLPSSSRLGCYCGT